EVAALVGPLVPDRDAMIVEIFDVGVAGEEPEQLVDDRLDVQLLGGEEREAVSEVEPNLVAEYGERARTGAVALLDAVRENAFHQVVVLGHRLWSRAGSESDASVYRPPAAA